MCFYSSLIFIVTVTATSAGMLFVEMHERKSLSSDHNHDHSTIWPRIWFAEILGLTSVCVGLVQFLPQLYQTYMAGSIGALSIPTMLVQVPGSFLLAWFLACQPATNFTTW